MQRGRSSPARAGFSSLCREEVKRRTAAMRDVFLYCYHLNRVALLVKIVPITTAKEKKSLKALFLFNIVTLKGCPSCKT